MLETGRIQRALAHRQTVIVVLALLLWALFPVATIAAFAVAYLASWALIAATAAVAPRVEIPGAAVGITGLIAAGAFAFSLSSAWPEIRENDGLVEFGVARTHRWALDAMVDLAPVTLAAHRPERVWIRAPENSRVRFSVPGAPPVVATSLGHELYTGVLPAFEADVDVLVTIFVDGEAHVRARSVQNEVSDRIAGCAGSEHLAFVDRFRDRLIVVGPDDGVRALPTEDGPISCAFLPTSSIVVSHAYSDALLIVDAQSDYRELLARVRHQGDVSTAPDGSIAVIRKKPSAVVVLDPTTKRRQEIALDFRAEQIVAGPAGSWILSDLPGHRVVRVSDSKESSLRLGRPPLALVSDVERNRGYFVVSDDVLPGAAGENHEANEQVVAFDLSSLEVLSRFETWQRGADGQVVGGGGPTALEPQPDGSLLVGFAGSSELGRWNPTTKRWTFWKTAENLPVLPVLVWDRGPRTLVVSALRPTIQLIDSDSGALRPLPLPAETERPHPVLAEGARSFFETTRSGLSCATCHPNAKTDHAQHDIGHGSGRPTLTVRGVRASAPYLRGASYPSLRSLDAFAHGVLGGYSRSSPARSSALAAFINQLGERRTQLLDVDSFEAQTETLRRGVDAFVTGRCVSCHQFPRFTNLTQYPSRLLFPNRGGADRISTRDAKAPDRAPAELLDTPSLLGLSESGPYFHDGSATTVMEVVNQSSKSGRHGDFSRLDQRALEDLTKFLEAL